ncbi:hypothetical protein J6590_036900 [Homalodisca vitripennis]|nr:hypothetical protein J6590_036900 [Homalodisca vitripennis]
MGSRFGTNNLLEQIMVFGKMELRQICPTIEPPLRDNDIKFEIVLIRKVKEQVSWLEVVEAEEILESDLYREYPYFISLFAVLPLLPCLQSKNNTNTKKTHTQESDLYREYPYFISLFAVLPLLPCLQSKNNTNTKKTHTQESDLYREYPYFISLFAVLPLLPCLQSKNNTNLYQFCISGRPLEAKTGRSSTQLHCITFPCLQPRNNSNQISIVGGFSGLP